MGRKWADAKNKRVVVGCTAMDHSCVNDSIARLPALLAGSQHAMKPTSPRSTAVPA
jgi:hypothetical protein